MIFGIVEKNNNKSYSFRLSLHCLEFRSLCSQVSLPGLFLLLYNFKHLKAIQSSSTKVIFEGPKEGKLFQFSNTKSQLSLRATLKSLAENWKMKRENLFGLRRASDFSQSLGTALQRLRIETCRGGPGIIIPNLWRLLLSILRSHSLRNI